MEKLAKVYDVGKVLNVASYAHMYVFEFDGKIIGTGSISSFWGSETESILLSIFVLPEFHGKSVGRKIINLVIKQHTGAWVPLTSLLWRGVCFWSVE